MSCILLCLSNLYIEAAVGYIAPLSKQPVGHWLYDINETSNPRGRMAIGQEWNPTPKVRISFELRHESWIGTTKDQGENGAWMSVRVLPFR